MQGAQVWSVVGELRSHMPPIKREKTKKDIRIAILLLFLRKLNFWWFSVPLYLGWKSVARVGRTLKITPCFKEAVLHVWVVSVLCLVTQSCLTLCDPMDCSLPGSSVNGDSPGKNTGVGCHALLQGIFPTQELNPALSHCRQILYQLNHQGSPRILDWAAYPFSSESSQPFIEDGFFSRSATREALWIWKRKQISRYKKHVGVVV